MLSFTPWYVYILECSDGSYYVGITPNMESRLKLHNKGLAAKHTKDHRPVILVYSKLFSNKSEARKREIQLKGWSRQKKRKLINGDYK